MSLITRSRVNKRVYERKFDHDECIRLRGEDPQYWTYPRLAERFGVSQAAVERILNPNARARQARHSKDYARKRKVSCLGGCGKLVWAHGHRPRTGYCTSCLAARETRDRVREHELLCLKCEKWKPDAEFPTAQAGKRRRGVMRRGLRTWCRDCCTAARRDFRHRHAKAHAATERSYAPVRRERRTSMALYVVLRQNGDGFEQVAETEAVNPDLAIENVAAQEGVYVAIPLTRFELVPVAPRTSLRVSRKED